MLERPRLAGPFTRRAVFPLAMPGCIRVLHPAPNVALILLLQSAVPPVTSVAIFVERSGGNRRIANRFVLASFLAALLVLPAMVGLLTKITALP